MNNQAIQALQLLRKTENIENSQEFIFVSNRSARNNPISRIQAYLIIHNAAEELGIQNIGCHSLRKTFGYHAWKQGIHPALIMSIYNHSSIGVTKRYLGIEQQDKDDVFHTINF